MRSNASSLRLFRFASCAALALASMATAACTGTLDDASEANVAAPNASTEAHTAVGTPAPIHATPNGGAAPSSPTRPASARGAPS